MPDAGPTPPAPLAELNAESEDEAVLGEDEIDTLLAGAPWQRFVLLGDSIAEGISEPVAGYLERPWGDRVADGLRRVHPSLKYKNLGYRFLRAPALDFGPDLAAVVGGGNNIAAERFDPAPVEGALNEIVERLTRAGATVAIMTMFDISKAFQIHEELCRRIVLLHAGVRAVAKRHGSVLIDLETLDACADPGIYTSDLLHANARGHAIAASEAVRRLGERLAQGDDAA